MAESEPTHVRFDIAQGVDVSKGRNILIKKAWLDYMQTEDYAALQSGIYNALNEVVQYVQTLGKGSSSDEFISAHIQEAREANSELLKKLPSEFDWSARIRELERQALEDC